MDKARFERLITEQFNAIFELTKTKGEEYSQSDDQLANFKRQSRDLGVSPELVLAVYLNKHLGSIMGYVKAGTPGNKAVPLTEPIEGRIDDAILYLLLLRAMVVDVREQEGGEPFPHIPVSGPPSDIPVPPFSGGATLTSLANGPSPDPHDTPDYSWGRAFYPPGSGPDTPDSKPDISNSGPDTPDSKPDISNSGPDTPDSKPDISNSGPDTPAPSLSGVVVTENGAFPTRASGRGPEKE